MLLSFIIPAVGYVSMPCGLRGYADVSAHSAHRCAVRVAKTVHILSSAPEPSRRLSNGYRMMITVHSFFIGLDVQTRPNLCCFDVFYQRFVPKPFTGAWDIKEWRECRKELQGPPSHDFLFTVPQLVCVSLRPTHTMSVHYAVPDPWAPMRPRWDPSVSYEPTVLHRYNPHSQPRKPALKRPARFSFSPHFNESPLHDFSRSHASIHPFLASTDRPALIWDISVNPERIVPSYSFRGDWYRMMSEPATETPHTSLDVVHKDGMWQAAFNARAGYAPPHFSRPSTYVTVGDVLYTLYDRFRRPVRNEDYDRVCTKFKHLKDGVLHAYWDRCQYGRTTQEAQQEINQGIRVVDLFMGSLTWVGLTCGSSSRELRLHVRPGRPMY